MLPLSVAYDSVALSTAKRVVQEMPQTEWSARDIICYSLVTVCFYVQEVHLHFIVVHILDGFLLFVTLKMCLMLIYAANHDNIP